MDNVSCSSSDDSEYKLSDDVLDTVNLMYYGTEKYTIETNLCQNYNEEEEYDLFDSFSLKENNRRIIKSNRDKFASLSVAVFPSSKRARFLVKGETNEDQYTRECIEKHFSLDTLLTKKIQKNHINLAGSKVIDQSRDVIVEDITSMYEEEDFIINNSDFDCVENKKTINEVKTKATPEEIKIIEKYSNHIQKLINAYKEALNQQIKFMPSHQHNSHTFPIALLRKCIKIVNMVSQIENEELQTKIIEEALTLFNRKISNTLKFSRTRIRVPVRQLELCILAIMLKLDIFSTKVIDPKFTTKFIQFVTQLDMPELTVHLQKVNVPFYVIYNVMDSVGFHEANLGVAHKVYRSVEKCAELHQKTPKNFALAIMGLIDPSLKVRIPKIGNSNTVENICSILTNYMKVTSEYNPFIIPISILDGKKNYVEMMDLYEKYEALRLGLKIVFGNVAEINHKTNLITLLTELKYIFQNNASLNFRVSKVGLIFNKLFFDPLNGSPLLNPFFTCDTKVCYQSKSIVKKRKRRCAINEMYNH